MFIWDRIKKIRNAGGVDNTIDRNAAPVPYCVPHYAVVDVEVGFKDHKIHDIGALRDDGAVFHETSKPELFEFFKKLF